MNLLYFAIPLTSAVVAWATCRLLIGFMLKPENTIKFAGISIQGVLPYLQQNPNVPAAVLAGEAKKVIDTKMASATLEQIRPVIEMHLDNYLTIRLKEKLPVIASFIGPSTTIKLKESMIEEIDTLLPQVFAAYIDQNFTRDKMEKNISEKIAEITPQHVVKFVDSQKVRMRSMTGAAIITGTIIGIIADAVCFFITMK